MPFFLKKREARAMEIILKAKEAYSQACVRLHHLNGNSTMFTEFNDRSSKISTVGLCT
jgi:hypothetical protein